jgi:hypothetical protein
MSAPDGKPPSPPCPRLEAKVKERTEEDLRGLVVELVAVDESGKDQMSTLEKPELQKMWSTFSHQKLDLADIVTQVCAMLLSISSIIDASNSRLCATDVCIVHQAVLDACR